MLKKTKVKRRNTEPSIVPLPANIAASPANDWSTYSFSHEHNYFSYYCSLIWTLPILYSCFEHLSRLILWLVVHFVISSPCPHSPFYWSLGGPLECFLYILYIYIHTILFAPSFFFLVMPLDLDLWKLPRGPCPASFLSDVYCFAFNTYTATLTRIAMRTFIEFAIYHPQTVCVYVYRHLSLIVTS